MTNPKNTKPKKSSATHPTSAAETSGDPHGTRGKATPPTPTAPGTGGTPAT